MLNLRERVMNLLQNYLSSKPAEREFIDLGDGVNLLEGYKGDLSDSMYNSERMFHEIDRIASLATMPKYSDLALPQSSEELNEFFKGRIMGMGPSGNVYNKYINSKVKRKEDKAIFANVGFGAASNYVANLENLKNKCSEKGVTYEINLINIPNPFEDNEPLFEDEKFGSYRGELFFVDISVPQFGYSKKIVRDTTFLREQVMFTDKYGHHFWADLNFNYGTDKINTSFGIISNKKSKEFKEFEAKRLMAERFLYYEFRDLMCALYKPLIPF